MQMRQCGCGNDNMNDNMNDSMNDDMEMNQINYDNQMENKVDCDLRREMMDSIRSLEFAINELALYLDTHPEDERALCLHRKYAKQAKDLKDKYQRAFGPLTINYPCNKWRWLEEPWDWFELEVN